MKKGIESHNWYFVSWDKDQGILMKQWIEIRNLSYQTRCLGISITKLEVLCSAGM